MLLISDVSSKALNDAEGCRVQKWEYLVVEQAGDKWNYDADNDWRMGSSNDLLKDLGREGWELIGVRSRSSSLYGLFFKRPKQ
jgi:hypothetical protein